MAEVEERKSSGVAKAGLVTGIIGAAGAAMELARGNGLFGGNNDKVNALRDENILLKSELATNGKVQPLEVQVVEMKGEIKNLQQALQFEGTQRMQGDGFLRQYIEDNFVKADKCVPAAKLNPPCVTWGTGLPSYAQPIFAPLMPWGPLPPPPVQNGGTTTPAPTSGGTGSGTQQ